MTRHRYYVGTHDSTGKPVDRWDDVEAVFLYHFGGFTRYDADGAWCPEQGAEPVREQSRIYECVGETCVLARKVAACVRDIARQSSVLYTVETVEGAFV